MPLTCSGLLISRSQVLNDHPLFGEASPLFPLLPEDWPRYQPGQFPVAERLYRNTLKLIVSHDDEDLADAYVRAFEKVLSNHRHLLKEQTA